jgi:transcriptional regulator GlxA family with amidase domain
MATDRKRTLGVVLFPKFELLDVFGPLEMFGKLAEQSMIDIVMVAQRAGAVASAQGPAAVADRGFGDCPRLDLLLVPGGMGTRTEVDNPVLIDWLRARASDAEIAMTVCTGAALLARTGALDGCQATTNKRSFAWVAEQGPRVQWVEQARWVEDGKFVTSSGVSAGIDMALAVIARLGGQALSEELATAAEYDWHRDPRWDPFAKVHGLV